MNITFTKTFFVWFFVFIILISIIGFEVYKKITEPSEVERIAASSSIDIEINSLGSCSLRAEALTVIAQRNLKRDSNLSLAASNLALIYFSNCNDIVASPTPEVSP